MVLLQRPRPVYKPAVEGLVIAAIGTSLVVNSALSTLTFILCALGLILIISGRPEKYPKTPPTTREVRLIGFALTFLALAIVVTWSLNGFSYEGFKRLGKYARLLLFWPLFVALARAQVRESTAFLAVLTCAALAGGDAIIQILNNPLPTRAQGGMYSIAYGNLSLLSAFLLLVTVMYAYRSGHKTLLGLALSGALLGLSAAFLSQTRNNFIAMLILLMFLLVASPPRQRLVLAGIGSLTLAICIGLDSRTGESLSNFWNGQFDESVALRLEIWRHAFSLFLEAPITGVGAEQYATSVVNSVDSGDLSSRIASCCARHAHNDLLQALSQRGLIGALAWLLVIVIPFTQFVRFIGHENPRVAHLATAGALIPLAYLGFGLTEATFEHGIYVTFYLVSITVLTHLTWRSGHEPL